MCGGLDGLPVKLLAASNDGGRPSCYSTERDIEAIGIFGDDSFATLLPSVVEQPRVWETYI